jgi:hypothetical protein
MSKIFISYRREESAWPTGRICDHLYRRFGVDNFVRDVDHIPAGCDFREYISQAVNRCQVPLAVIGEQWSDIRFRDGPKQGQRRLDDPADFVRIEIEAALQRNVPVIPLMVGVPYLHEEQLPLSLKPLAFRHGHFIRPDPDFLNDIARLIESLVSTLEKTWFYVEDRRKAGPVLFAQLRDLVARDKLQRTDMIWAEGTQHWVQAGSVEGLFDEDGEETDDGDEDEFQDPHREIDDFETDEIMARIRQKTRGRGWMDREELLKEVSLTLGFQRLGPRIRETMESHLRTAIKRKILEPDSDQVRIYAASMDQYDLEVLRDTLCSVMRAGKRYEREEVIQLVSHYLGFSRVTDNVRQSMKSAFRSGLLQGILSADGDVIWRE